MANNNPDSILETRYATSHAGGAFDAKNIQKPKSVKESLEKATLGKTSDKSLMVEGLDTTKYIKRDDILGQKKQDPTFVDRRILPNSVELRPATRAVKLQPVLIGQNSRRLIKRPEEGNGDPGTPTPRPFTPKQVKFGPLVELKLPIYWNTDPDIWNLNKIIGQVYWDS